MGNHGCFSICSGTGGGIIETLSGLEIGSLTLSPEFNAEVTEYTATTTNNTNKITATTDDEDATITILVNDEPVENESSATWETGENEVVITVSKEGAISTTYTVVVTKGE